MLPTEVDTEKVVSSFENGELTLTLPKAVDRRSRRIPITAGEKPAQAVGPGVNGPATDTAPTAPPARPGEAGRSGPDGPGDPRVVRGFASLSITRASIRHPVEAR